MDIVVAVSLDTVVHPEYQGIQEFLDYQVLVEFLDIQEHLE